MADEDLVASGRKKVRKYFSSTPSERATECCNCQTNCLWKCGSLFWEEARRGWAHTLVELLPATIQK